MTYTEVKKLVELNKNQQNNPKITQENSQVSKIVDQNYFKVHYGKWVMLIMLILLFDLLTSLFSSNIFLILLGLITKIFVIKSPESLVFIMLFQNAKVQEIIQKLHLEVHLQIILTKVIDLYLNFSQKLNFYIVFYRIEEKQERIQILNRIKDSVSRIQLQLQDDEEVKNKSFIVAIKKMQNTSKKIKSYENVGVNCDILKGSEVGKEILKILEEKTLPKEKQKIMSISKIQQPTKDRQDDKKNITKSAVNTPRSESLQQKMKKIKQGVSVNIPTSEKNMTPNQQAQQQSHFMIKRSQTFDIEEFQFQESPVSNKGESNQIVSYGPIRTQKNITKKVEYSQSITVNSQNIGRLDIDTTQKSSEKNSQINQDDGNMGHILEALHKNQENEVGEPQILPQGTLISSIDQKTIHPFKVNLSSLTNPLIISGQNSKSKILPSSLYSSQQNLLISSGKNLKSSQSIDPSKKQQFPNISQVHTEIMMQQFSEQSTIPNKLNASLSESEYSDMFESDEQENEPKLEIKVEAVVQNRNSTNALKPRIDICNIELYDNKDLKFYSVYNHLIFSGKIVRMEKSSDNFYEIICEQSKNIQDGKQVKNLEQKVQLVKKVKFRGQAKPFMKYLTEKSS